MRTTVVRLTAVALVALAACTGQAGQSPESDLRYVDCGDAVNILGAGIPQKRLDRLDFSCITLTVPVDHARRKGDTLDLAVVRVISKDRGERIGSLVMNPGGPGQPGLDYLPLWASWLSDDILEHFDVVSFDPRGVGSSAGINCGPMPDDDELRPFPDLVSGAGWAHATESSSRFAAACRERLGDAAGHFNTTATAQDLELLRRALDDDRLTYVGFSYGAKLGGEYARRSPDRVRALVLDAPSDPQVDPLARVEQQVEAFERSFGSYARGCAERPTCATIRDPRRFVADLMAAANRKPIPSRRRVDTLPATGIDVIEAVIALLYDDNAWTHLDQTLLEAARGDSGSMFEAAQNVIGPDEDDGPDAANASLVINCNDTPADPPEREVRNVARRLTATYPTFGGYASAWLYGCRSWTTVRTPLAAPNAPDAPPILVIGTVHDPATPYIGAVHFADSLGSGRLLTWEGEGHTAYGQSSCINDIVDAYLVSLTLPAPETTCP